MANIRKLSIGRYDLGAFSLFFAYSVCIQIIPMVLVQMSDDLGFSMREGSFAEGSWLQIARWLPAAFSAFICSFIAARFGKRRTLGVAMLLMCLGIVLSSIAPNYLLIFLSLLIAGVANGIAGTLSPPFVRSLHPAESGRYINFLNSFWALGTLFTVIVAGGLLSIGVSWRIIVCGSGLLTLIGALTLLLPENPHNKYPEQNDKLNPKQVFQQMLKVALDRRFIILFLTMLIFAGGEGVLMFWSASYIQLNFSGSAWAGGIGTGIFAIGMIISRILVGLFIPQHRLKQAIIGAALFGFFITLGFPEIKELWLLFIVLFLSGIATAPIWPSLISHSAERLTHLDKTTTMILITLSATPGRILFTFLVGYIAELTGNLTAAFYLVPAYFIIVAIMTFIEGLFPLSKDIINEKNEDIPTI